MAFLKKLLDCIFIHVGILKPKNYQHPFKNHLSDHLCHQSTTKITIYNLKNITYSPPQNPEWAPRSWHNPINAPRAKTWHSDKIFSRNNEFYRLTIFLLFSRWISQTAHRGFSILLWMWPSTCSGRAMKRELRWP